MGVGEIVVEKEGIREDLLKWKVKEVTKLAALYDDAFHVVVELLEDKDPQVRANALQVIKDLIKAGNLPPERVGQVLKRVIELTGDEEKVALKAIEVLNELLARGELSDDEYEMVTQALMDVVKRGMPILSEYAAEGLGKLGSVAVKIARRIIGWLFNIVRSSKDREVQSAAIATLTEMAYQTEDRALFNEIADKMADLIEHPDPYIRERALMSIDRLLSKAHLLTKRSRIKVLKKSQSVSGDVKLAAMANLIREKLEKVEETGEEVITKEELKKKLEISEYGPEDVERLLDAGKTEVVVELAKIDQVVLSKILDMLSSEDPMRRADALWVVSRLTTHLTPSDAYSVLPALGEFLKSNNPWMRKTAAETMADIYTLYPGTSQFFTSLLDVLLKSKKKRDAEGALELISSLWKRMPTPEFSKAIMLVVKDLLEEPSTRGVTLRYLAREAERLLEMDVETLKGLEEVLKGIYGVEGGKHDNIIAALIDAISGIIQMKSTA
ncbi:hypothetical protein [Thermococcus sp.]|uniref:hypothetical protein n=1 Tax=Thermococcus sp. TaxID=35749 RepID=UPI002615B074|nr:hypothetical protein [Thermococcus sp.]